VLTQHAGTLGGHDCITTLYHLNDGSVFAAYRIVGQPLYGIDRADAGPAETLDWQSGERSRQLRVTADGTVTGMSARGDWPDAHLYHLFVLDSGRIGALQRQSFLRSGTFEIAGAPALASGVVCHCMSVTEEMLRAAMSRGAKTFTRLQEA